MASVISAGTTSGTSLNLSGDTSGVLQLASNGSTTAVTIDTSQNVGIGTASPTTKLHVVGRLNVVGSIGTISTDSQGLTLDLNRAGTTGITNNNASGVLTLGTATNEVMRLDSSGTVGIGTSSPSGKLDVFNATATEVRSMSSTTSSYANFIVDVNNVTTQRVQMVSFGSTASDNLLGIARANNSFLAKSGGLLAVGTRDSNALVLSTNETERMRIDSAGEVLIGKTSTASSVAGIRLNPLGTAVISRNDELLFCNRLTTDGALVQFQQDGVSEGNISVSGSTVSYNGGHLSRWSQLPNGSKDESIVKGTVMSNLDDMCVWEKDGVVAENEQLNKMKVSDVEGDTNVAGVFVNWTMDEQYGVDDMNVAMTGDMIIRIADGVVVQKGDLLMSAGDGTAKPQGDDIRRSKTVAKVTSNHVTCTYADGSYCVPCVLMAC